MSDFPRQDTSWEAVPNDVLPAPKPLGDVLDEIEHDNIDTQLQKLEEIKQEQQSRISKLLLSIKEKRRKEETSKAATKKFSESERASIRTIFDKYDSNSSGYIEAGEFQKMVEELGVKIPEASIPTIVKSLAAPMDADKINFDAFLTWWGSDSTRGGNKGLSLAIARGKLKALRTAKKGSDRVNAAKLKAAIGLPIEIDATTTIGEVKVPRTQLNTKISTSRKEDFDKILAAKFPESEQENVCVVSLVFDLATDVAPEKMEKFKSAVPLVVADIESAGTKNSGSTNSVTACHFSNDTCTIDVGIAFETDKLLNALFCTTTPDQEELDKFISEAETDIRMGVDLSKFLRESYRDGKSLIDILNDGLIISTKGRISPSIIALFRAVVGSGGSGEKAVFIRKCAEVGISSMQGYSCTMAYRSKQAVLAKVTNFVTNEVRKEIAKVKNLQYEEEQLENELRMLSNLLMYKATMKTESINLANASPEYSAVVKKRAKDDDSEDENSDDSSDWADDQDFSGWNNNECTPAEFLFLLAECVSEVKSVKAWSPWVNFSLEGTGLALTAGLPHSLSEIRKDDGVLVLTTEYIENKAAIAGYSFPTIKKAYELKEEESISLLSDSDEEWNIFEILSDLFDEQETMAEEL
eukprot:TRINITY_DN509_c0_g1_i1.p1 TRINITY_DN509_c0_g1~~TRINITY_DN509_c0_g1_i1.p1  ORF type:complete len:639 (+),score=136.15 TRINITY_DN509_c0_g1_i1:73-1989(+)